MTIRSGCARASLVGAVLLAVSAFLVSPTATADETCQSPYMAKITGQEDFVYVWTLGMEGVPMQRRRGHWRVIDDCWRDMPYLTTSRRVVERGNFAATTQVPEGCEGVILLVGGVGVVQPMVDSWRAKGWCVGSMSRGLDHLVFA